MWIVAIGGHFVANIHLCCQNLIFLIKLRTCDRARAIYVISLAAYFPEGGNL